MLRWSSSGFSAFCTDSRWRRATTAGRTGEELAATAHSLRSLASRASRLRQCLSPSANSALSVLHWTFVTHSPPRPYAASLFPADATRSRWSRTNRSPGDRLFPAAASGRGKLAIGKKSSRRKRIWRRTPGQPRSTGSGATRRWRALLRLVDLSCEFPCVGLAVLANAPSATPTAKPSSPVATFVLPPRPSRTPPCRLLFLSACATRAPSSRLLQTSFPTILTRPTPHRLRPSPLPSPPPARTTSNRCRTSASQPPTLPLKRWNTLSPLFLPSLLPATHPSPPFWRAGTRSRSRSGVRGPSTRGSRTFRTG